MLIFSSSSPQGIWADGSWIGESASSFTGSGSFFTSYFLKLAWRLGDLVMFLFENLREAERPIGDLLENYKGLESLIEDFLRIISCFISNQGESYAYSASL